MYLTPVITLLDEQFSTLNQSLNFSRVVKHNTQRFKVSIRRNAYDNQSHATVSLWTPNGWTEVHRHLDIRTLLIGGYSYVATGTDWVKAAHKDAEELLRTAYSIAAV